MNCEYCDINHNLVYCNTCQKLFCNTRSTSSISHIVFHLVKAKHRFISIWNDEIKQGSPSKEWWLKGLAKEVEEEKENQERLQNVARSYKEADRIQSDDLTGPDSELPGEMSRRSFEKALDVEWNFAKTAPSYRELRDRENVIPSKAVYKPSINFPADQSSGDIEAYGINKAAERCLIQVLCKKCGERNVFKLVHSNAKIFCKECCEGIPLVEERCLTIVESMNTGVKMTKQDMALIEEQISKDYCSNCGFKQWKQGYAETGHREEGTTSSAKGIAADISSGNAMTMSQKDIIHRVNIHDFVHNTNTMDSCAWDCPLDATQLCTCLEELPSVKVKFEPDDYLHTFSSLIKAECACEKDLKESMKQENVIIRWEKRYGYFYVPKHETDLKISIGDEIRLSHRSNITLIGFVVSECFSEELKIEVERSGDYPRSGWCVEYLWREVCYDRMLWALNKIYKLCKNGIESDDMNKGGRCDPEAKKSDINEMLDSDEIVNLRKTKESSATNGMVAGENGRDSSNYPQCIFSSTKVTEVEEDTNSKNQHSANPHHLRQCKQQANTKAENSLFATLLKGKSEVITTYKKIFLPPSFPVLNSAQETAVRAALSRSITLIQGPPGTGKTLVSSAIVYNLAKHFKGKILVVAPSNTAVDQLTLKIYQTGLKVIRVMSRRRELAQSDVAFLSLHESMKSQNEMNSHGDSHTSSKVCKQFIIQQTSVEYESTPLLSVDCAEGDMQMKYQLLNSADVITCTCVTSGQKLFNRFRFPYVLIDEAVQSTEPLSLIPLVYGCKKLVLVGDHKQLGPTILSKKVAQAGFKQSLFERLILLNIKPYMLNVQYRMHSELCEWPSEMFYNGDLTSGKTKFMKFNLGIPINFFYACYGKEEISASGTSFINTAEAIMVERVIRHLFKCGIIESQIGVITPYEGQRSYILNKIFGSEPGNLEISNVDGFQGREKDFIIVSLVRSNLYQGIGFVGDKRRMNVTITRAKYGLIILGNPLTLAKHEIWKNLIDFYERKGLLLEGEIGDLKRCNAMLRFDFKSLIDSL